jgi:hypothetical protein
MSPQDDEAAIAAFLRTRGVTRCPTACAAVTHASVSVVDREALRRRAEYREALHDQKLRQAKAYLLGVAA